MEQREIAKQLWNSVDAKFQRRMLGVVEGMLCLCGAVLIVLWHMKASVALTMTIVVCIISLPLLLWQMWRLVRIFCKAEHYTFFHTKLSAPKGDCKAVAFAVTVPSGEKYLTDRIYYIRNLDPLLSDYLDKTVTAAWNSETGMVIVISK